MITGREIGGLIRLRNHNNFSKFPNSRKLCLAEKGVKQTGLEKDRFFREVAKEFGSDEVITKSFSQRELEYGILNLGGRKGFRRRNQWEGGCEGMLYIANMFGI